MAAIIKITGHNRYKTHRILLHDGAEFNFFENKKNSEPTSSDMLVKNNDQGTDISSKSKNIISNSDENVNIQLSLQETAKARETREQLIKENANLRVANKLLKSEMQLTKGNVLPYETAKQIAKNLMKEYSSEYNVQ